MAQGEYAGKRVTATVDEDIYNKLIIDAKVNGIKPSTRAAQLLSLYYNGQLSLNGAPASVPDVTQAMDQPKSKEEEQEIVYEEEI